MYLHFPCSCCSECPCRAVEEHPIQLEKFRSLWWQLGWYKLQQRITCNLHVSPQTNSLFKFIGLIVKLTASLGTIWLSCIYICSQNSIQLGTERNTYWRHPVFDRAASFVSSLLSCPLLSVVLSYYLILLLDDMMLINSMILCVFFLSVVIKLLKHDSWIM